MQRRQCDLTFRPKSSPKNVHISPKNRENIAQIGALANKTFCPKNLYEKCDKTFSKFRPYYGNFKNNAPKHWAIFGTNSAPNAKTKSLKFRPIWSH
jgi:hypothetical protein